jgi:hypothetical protein
MAYTDIDKATDYFTTFLWTGDGSTSPRVHTGVGLQADMMWSKVRSAGHQHNLVDRVRGVNQRLLMPSDSNDEDTTCTHGHFDSLDSDGFTTTNAGGNWNVNASGETYVGWFWKANGSGSSNTDGSITSTVSANTTSGFSIVSFTGTGSNATVGHSLGSTPSMIIVKDRDDSTFWGVYHKSLGATKYLDLDQTNASATGTNVWNDTEPTSSVFSVGTNGRVNNNTQKYIAYCFAEKKGFSKFGSYTGNGNADGTFVYTGFKPAFTMIKRTDTTSDWNIMDNKRAVSFNPNTKELYANSSQAEATGGQTIRDFLSNGFKLRGTSGGTNASGGTYIYMAFAEEPLVGDNPATAR